MTSFRTTLVSARFSSRDLCLASGETLLLYTDGLSEAQDPAGVGYGIERLSALAASVANLPAKEIVYACLRDLVAFRGVSASTDDLTVMAIQRV